MACENLSKYYPIVMKCSGYLPLYEDTSAFDFGPDWSNLLAGQGPEMGHNELHCWSVCEGDRDAQGRYSYVSLNNLVIAVPKIGQMSQSGTFPECRIFLVSRLFCHPCVTEKEPSLTKNCRKRLSLRWDTGLKWDNTDLIALVFLWFSYSSCVL